MLSIGLAQKLEIASQPGSDSRQIMENPKKIADSLVMQRDMPMNFVNLANDTLTDFPEDLPLKTKSESIKLHGYTVSDNSTAD